MATITCIVIDDISKAAKILGREGGRRRHEASSAERQEIGKRSAATMRERYGEDVYKRVRAGEKLTKGIGEQL